METKKQQEHIPLHASVRMRYIFQDKGARRKELLKSFPKYSCRSIYRHASKPFSYVENDKRKYNRGRPPKLSLEIKGPSNAKFQDCVKQLIHSQ